MARSASLVGGAGGAVPAGIWATSGVTYVFQQSLGLKTTTMALIISDDLLTRFDYEAEEFVVDFACFLYEKRRISIGKASKLAGLNRIEFQMALKDRNIYLNYDEEELDADLRNLDFLP